MDFIDYLEQSNRDAKRIATKITLLREEKRALKEAWRNNPNRWSDLTKQLEAELNLTPEEKARYDKMTDFWCKVFTLLTNVKAKINRLFRRK